jgi:hypothetical protein
MVFEVVAALKLANRERTVQLRRRCLALILDGMRAGQDTVLPGPAPTWQEINQRWAP